MNKLHIPPLDEQAAKTALEHQKILAKPPLALGKLEPVAIQIAAMTGNPAPRLKDKAVVLFAADHHIADHGLSLTPSCISLRKAAFPRRKRRKKSGPPLRPHLPIRILITAAWSAPDARK